MCLRTLDGLDEELVALAGEVHVGISVCEVVDRIDVGKVDEHGLLHRELRAGSACASRVTEANEPCTGPCPSARPAGRYLVFYVSWFVVYLVLCFPSGDRVLELYLDQVAEADKIRPPSPRTS